MAANVGLFSALKGELTKSTKEYEARKEIKKQLSSAFESYDELLLENFFYSFNPVVRAMVDPEAFQKLFLILVKN